MAQIESTQAHCPQCKREVRISEPFAFGGRDRLRSTLACGHVVLRPPVVAPVIQLAHDGDASAADRHERQVR